MCVHKLPLTLLFVKIVYFTSFTLEAIQDVFFVYVCILYIWVFKASWRKRLDARLPPLGSRVRISVPPCGFRGGRNGVWVGFSRGFSRFPLPQISFHHTHLYPFRFISSALVMARQPWSAGTLATHGPII